MAKLEFSGRLGFLIAYRSARLVRKQGQSDIDPYHHCSFAATRAADRAEATRYKASLPKLDLQDRLYNARTVREQA